MSAQQSTQPLWLSMILAGISGSIAELITIPIDTAKVRLQLQGEILSEHTNHKYTSFAQCILKISKEEGTRALWQGSLVAVKRQMIYSGIRMGAYGKIRDLYSSGRQEGFTQKILAAMTTGSMAILLANPLDVVKIRFQGQSLNEQRRYKNLRDAYKQIYHLEGGLRGFWVGVGPNMVRNAIVNSSLVASYDQIKNSLLKTSLFADDFYCYLTSSTLAGCIATIVSNPVEVTRIRIMNANKLKNQQYKNVTSCVYTLMKDEGILSFYHGVGAFGTRLITYNVLCFISLEYITQLYYHQKV